MAKHSSLTHAARVRAPSVPLRAILFAAAVLSPAVLSASPAHAGLVLNGITYVADSNSSGTGGEGTFNTTGTSVQGTYNAFLAHGSLSTSPSFINTSGDSNLNLVLSPGTYTFTLYMNANTGSGYGSIDLFFNGNTPNPVISVFATATGSLSSVPPFYADGQGGQLELNAHNWVNGAGSLSYDDGTQTVTLTNFMLADAALDIADGHCVGTNSVGSVSCSSQPNQVATQFTLAVKDNVVPEPMSAALLGFGLLGVAAARQWHT